MLARSFVFALACFATSRVFAEEKKSKPTGVTVDVNKDVLDHVAVETSTDRTVVTFTLHDGHAVEKVVEGDKIVKTFDLDTQAPKSLAKHVFENKPHVLVTVEPALRLAFKKDGDKWVDEDVGEFHEKVWFKGAASATVDLEKLEDATVFTATTFGTGKKHTFAAAGKRVGKVVSGDNTVLSGDYEVVLELDVFVGGDKKFLKLVYLYKPDGRLKEVFFEKTDKTWTRVEVKTAATALHGIDADFPADYKVAFDGFSVSGLFFAVAALAFSTLFY